MAWSKQATILGPQGPVGIAPTGAEIMWPVATPPAGWLIEDGSSQLIASYPDLSALIRGTYGGVDGTHFSLPDMRGMVPVGYKSGDANFGTLGGTGGEKTHALTSNEVPPHVHYADSTGTKGFVVSGTGNMGTANITVGGGGYALAAGTDINPGSYLAHNNLQPYRTRSFIIKT